MALVQNHGRVEREVVRACAGANLLVLARDGDRQHLGPAARFVVDHPPCATPLVWPDTDPGMGTLPSP